jgi:hypothetical protein
MMATGKSKAPSFLSSLSRNIIGFSPDGRAFAFGQYPAARLYLPSVRLWFKEKR